jgi:hypothetical protein
LAGCRVTIHEHLDKSVSIRYRPHVVGQFDSEGQRLDTGRTKERRGKGGSLEAGENQKQVFTGSHTPLGISQKTRDSHFSTAPTMSRPLSKTKTKSQAA